MSDDGYVRKQLGVLVRVDLWRALRVTALQRGTTATALLEQAIETYLTQLEEHPEGGGGLATDSKRLGNDSKETSLSSKSLKMEEGSNDEGSTIPKML